MISIAFHEAADHLPWTINPHLAFMEDTMWLFRPDQSLMSIIRLRVDPTLFFTGGRPFAGYPIQAFLHQCIC